MKTQNKIFMGDLAPNRVFGGIILIPLLLIFTFNLKGQQATHFPFPIGTPGTMVSQILDFSTGDIGYFVAYSTEGLLVYRASDHTLINTVPFQTNEAHGRFSPLIFDRNLWPGTMSYMVYSENQSMLYVVSPTLNIYRINALDLVIPGQGFGQVFIAKPAELAGRIMDGSNSLKYDNLNKRLFWLCGVKSPDNATGSFHIRANYFGVYDVDVNDPPGYAQIDGIYVNSAGDYTGTIFDFEYTREHNLNNFKVFLALKGNLKTIEYQKSNQTWTSTDLVNKATLNGKFSKLLSFTYDGAQRIAAFPYRLPFEMAGGEPVEPPIGDQVNVTWFAASNPAVTDSFPAPSKRITDACFDHTTNSILMTFGPYDVDGIKDMYKNQLNRDGFGNDLYVYPISGNSAPYMVNNNGEGYGLRLDNMNYPTYFCNAGNALFLCKKDELVRLVYNTSTQKFEQNRLIDARSAYFMGAIKAGSKYLILNILKNGVDVLNESFDQIDADAITFGKPVYHLAVNNLNRTYYLYHNMLTENPGLYAVKMDDFTDFEDLSSLVDKPIGAVICNPFNGDVLISENDIREGGSGKIIVLNKENELLTEIVIPGAINCTDIYVSPSGYVYVLGNAHGTSTAFISSFNAIDYTLIEEKLFEFPIEQGQDLKHYVSGYFEHNAASGHDYILLGDEEKSVEPYTTERYTTDGFALNSTEIARDSTEYLTSEEQKIIKVANGINIEKFYTGSNLKDLVFIPAQADVGGDYNKLLVREGAKTIKIIDAVDLTEKNSITMPGSVTYNPCIRFMSYDIERAKLYVLMDEANENAQPKAVSNRQFSVYEVAGLETMSPSISRLFFTAGHAAAMTYNRFNRQLYVYYKGDNTKEAGTLAKLYAINPDLATNNFTSVSFPYLAMEPEVYFKKAELYPDPYTNQIIVLHGGHCNLSTVGFTPHETIPLKPNTVNWISFPRLRLEPGQNYATLDRALNNHPVLANQGNIQPETFFNAYEKISYLKNNPSGALETSLINAFWNEEVPDWEPEQPIGIFEIISDLGYKSEIISNEQIHQLHLAGTVESPAHEKFLYAATDPANPARRRENWTGYWLYETQDIFDALGSYAQGENPAIYGIKHQDWSCVYTEWTPYGMQEPPYPGKSWQCSQSRTNISYGDMVVLRASADIPAFRWSNHGQPPYKAPDPGPVYYSYALQDDYTPIVIGLDSTAGVTEIGAFVNDSCVGACSVLAGDTVVVLNAYMNGFSGDSLYFEQYSPLKSLPADRRRPAYTLLNRQSGRYERKPISPRSRSEYHVVSFSEKQSRESTREMPVLAIRVYPNPAFGSIGMEINMPHEAPCEIVLHNLMGQQLAKLHHGWLGKGSHRLSIPLPQGLAKGVYMLKAMAGKSQAQQKLIVSH